MKTKIIPFNLEIAKKIQTGDIEGRIVTVNGAPIRVLALDIKDSHPIAVAVTRRNSNEVVYTCKSTGKYIEGDSNPSYDLAIELMEETPKYEFKPFDKVLVRDAYCEVWRPDIFSSMVYGPLYSCLRSDWHYCIPFEGNEHLVGTTNNPKEN